jgi:RNA polymerase sigma-70 factor (ECF subfamily)
MPAARHVTVVPDVGLFEAFVREYQDMVYAVAVRLLGNPADAEDVAQTVFLRAYERFDEIHDHPAVAGWLKTVTTNLCLSHLSRYRSRWQLFSEMPSADDAPAFDVKSRDDNAADALLRADSAARLEAAVHALPVHQRVPLVLFHFEHHSYDEIARLLDVSLGKVKTDIHRGRLALRRALS